MNDRDDEVTRRFRSLMDRRQFVDRERGRLLVWVAADRQELVELAALVEARHPGTRFAVHDSGSALAVQITARDDELAAIEELYVGGGDLR